jgi:putative ABC transport system permease protein
MGNLLGDVRYALRTLARQPTYTAVALLTLVLGIGTNTAIFSVIKAVLLNQLPYEAPSQLVVLAERNPDGNRDLVAPLTYGDWKEQSRTIPAMAAFRQLRYAFAGSGEPLDVPSIRATPNLFTVLRANAVLGRTFTAEEGTPGADHVAILSASFWRRHFGGSPSTIGRTIQLDAMPYTVVGIMDRDFDFPPGGNVDVWTPLAFDPADQHGRSRKARSLSIVGRLAGGANVEGAQREMTLIADRLAAAYPDSNAGWGARVASAREELVTTVRPALMLISGAVGALLLIVCANVASLVLASVSGRRTEIAVRAALGAGRWQLVRQVLVESTILSLGGGAIGLFVAWAGVRFVHALPEGSLPRIDEVQLDGGVLAFALAASLLVAVLFGLVPALHASRAGLGDAIHAFSGSTGRSGSRLMRGLVVVEVALALVLLVGAGLMIRSFAQLMNVAPGFEPHNLLAMQVYLPQAKYRTGADRTRFYADAIRRIGGYPGVTAAAAVSALPMYPVGIDFALPFTIDGKAPPTNGEEPRADIRMATPGYFETMKMRLVDGRFLDSRDRMGMPGTAVVNETMARRYFGGENPIGLTVVNPHGRAQVVGVVGDVKHYGLDRAPRAELFMSAWQQPMNGMSIVVRTKSDERTFVDPLRRQVLAVDAEQPIFDASAMVDVVARSVFLPRISMLLLTAFAITALLVAAVGIYGVVSYTVTERTRELGVRMALGALPGDTLRMVLRSSMWLVAAGAACGLVASAAMARAIGGLLYEVSPVDPLVIAGVLVLVAVCGLVASYVPARRATRVDPIVALRFE